MQAERGMAVDIHPQRRARILDEWAMHQASPFAAPTLCFLKVRLWLQRNFVLMALLPAKFYQVMRLW